ncbi:hypothetical protein SEA_TWISTER6_3 [Gordonia phage Twister6]|uniref:Uncharacterized protein n=1 Tax=Gordonia phage Twister6 TaxID=1887655 RepID=A0A1B3B1L8_9CAUD|nr:hypothetical protein BI083_gp03 [Gordonia phage Twister6]AOE44912.1 hypothetical protein SEA_TWISTER6_3 [Gordonia phage Twister6]
MPEVIAYWQRRWPQIDWAAAIDTAILETATVIGTSFGFPWDRIWEMRDTVSGWTLDAYTEPRR